MTLDYTTVSCPICHSNYHDFRLYSHLIAGHNISRKEAEIQTAQVVDDFLQDEGQLKEKYIISRWVGNSCPKSWFLTEVPISDKNNDQRPKNIDVVVSPEHPFDSKDEKMTKIHSGRSESLINVNTGEISKQPDKRAKLMQTVLDNLNSPVSIFEAKYEMNFKSIGQALVYSKFFSNYYDGYVDKVGIIYVEDDLMCRKTAEANGISTYKLEI